MTTQPDYTDLEVLVSDVAVQVRRLRGQLPLIDAIATTRGPGRTYIPPGVLAKMGQQYVETRRDRRRLEIASNAAAPVLSSKSPTNMATLSWTTDVAYAARHHLRRLTQWHQRQAGTVTRLDSHARRMGFSDPHTRAQALALAVVGPRATTPAALVDALYELLWTVDAPGLVRAVASDVEQLTARADVLIDGEDRRAFPGHCPWCGHQALVVYLQLGVITCERPREADGTRPPCVCVDSSCSCHHDPAYVHSWIRDTADHRRDSWASLAHHNARRRITKEKA